MDTVDITKSFSEKSIMTMIRQPLCSDDAVNVLDFKSKQDKDDTEALQKALIEAKRVNKPVYVPGGTYRISSTLFMEGQTLIGWESGSWPADRDTLPLLIVSHRNAPGIQMNGGVIAGLVILFEHIDSRTFTAYQEAIRIVGSDSTVINCKISQASKGIIVNGSNIRNLHLENLFFTQVHQLGVEVNGTVGKTILKNLEMWTATTTVMAGSPWQGQGIGIWLGDNEDLEMTDIFPFHCSEAFHFEDVNGKGTQKALMVNGSSDMTCGGVIISGSANVTMRGGTFWNHDYGLVLQEGSSGNIVVDAVQFKTNGAEACLIKKGTGTVKITGSMFRRTMKHDKGYTTLIRIQRDNVSLESCLFTARLVGNIGEVMQIDDDLKNVHIKYCISHTTNQAHFLKGGRGADVQDNVMIQDLAEENIDG
jgi:hypothetical protein